MRSLALAAALALLTVLPRPVSAQPPFDLKGGVNLTKFISDADVDGDQKRGLSLGAAVTPLQVGPVSVLLEGYYRQKGGGFRQALEASGATGEEIEIGLDYIEIPVLLRLTIPLGNRVGLHVQGGPVFGWQIDCGVEVAPASESTAPDCDDLLGGGLEETLQDYEQGIAGGAGLEVLVLGGAGAVTLDAIFTRGLSRLSDADQGPEVKNQAVGLMLGYSFKPALAAMR